jgi:hypothetical protein
MSDVGDLWCSWVVDGLVGMVDRVRRSFLMRAIQGTCCSCWRFYCILPIDVFRFR